MNGNILFGDCSKLVINGNRGNGRMDINVKGAILCLTNCRQLPNSHIEIVDSTGKTVVYLHFPNSQDTLFVRKVDEKVTKGVHLLRHHFLRVGQPNDD